MKILVIEDDPLVLEYVGKILTLAGYEVLRAENGKAGLEVLAAEPGIMIVVTDLIMPEKEGIETIVDVKKMYPAIKILAISGGGKIGPELYLKWADAFGADAFLQKPFARNDLIKIVEKFAAEINGQTP